MASASVIEDVASAEAIASEWDALAVGRSLPLCAPGWMLSWWRRMAPAQSVLRIIAVREDGELVALAPWFAQKARGGRTDVRFLGAEVSDRVDILCSGGRERDVVGALRQSLMELRPRPDLVSFEAVPIASSWTRRLAGGWDGVRLGRYRNSSYPAPCVTLPDGSPEAWLAARSRNFRGQMGRLRRRLEQRGGSVRQIVEPAEVERALRALLELHAGRWQGRGSSNLAREGLAEMLREAASTLGPDRLRLWAAEIEGEPISVQLFIAAGDEVKYWNGGWSEAHADLKPSMLTILAALQDAIARGQRRLDLGVGEHAYKLRFADSEDALTWGGLVVRNRRWAQTRAELAPRVLRYRAKLLAERLPEPAAERVASAVRARR
ncbi:MAG: GNAT family N-acetyltransferase, partial [Solirubrobacteraceae bacterium]